jgi:hypothetical protein
MPGGTDTGYDQVTTALARRSNNESKIGICADLSGIKRRQRHHESIPMFV